MAFVQYTTVDAETDYVLVDAANSSIRILSIAALLANDATADTSIEISLGGTLIVDHPGVPAGGGFQLSFKERGVNGGDVTLTCSASGGSGVGITIEYEIV